MVNMDSSTTKVSKRVARKINHYLNKEKVESEYDPSGKGIHTTNPLMANYELAYLVTTEDDNMKSLLTEKDQCSEGEMLVLPCLVPSAQCKSHVRRSDAKRVTSSARQVISSLPVKEIDMLRRYRPACRTTDTIETGKVSQMSRSVHAMLNTKEAVDFAVKRDKKTQRLRAKTAHQLQRPLRSPAAGGVQTASDNNHRAISSAKPARKKKLREKYAVLPFGPGNSSHIAAWLGEQKEKEIKATKKNEKRKKRAEKEAMIEKERREKEEIVTAMESLQTDDEKAGDKDEKKNEKSDELNETVSERRRSRRKQKERRKEKEKDELLSRHSSSTKSDDQPDVSQRTEEKKIESKNKEKKRINDQVDPENANDKNDSHNKTEDQSEPIRDGVTNDQSQHQSKEQNEDVTNFRKGEDDEIETQTKTVTYSTSDETMVTDSNTKVSDESATDEQSEKHVNDSKDINGTKTRSDSQTSVRTVEYVRTESVVSLPRS